MNFQHARLENGLQVIAELNEDAHAVALGFFVRTGSRDEPPELDGVSHFLEHMVFKGTERRNALEVNSELDRIGAKHNAQTSEEDTLYYLSCLPEYMPAAFDVLADILRPSLRAEDFETEKQVILEEIQMYQDDPMSVAFEEAKRLHYGHHVLGHSVLGTEQTVGALSLDHMQQYFRTRYGPSNIVLAVSGKTDWRQILDLAARHCGKWEGPPATRVAGSVCGTREFGSRLRSEDQQQTIVAVADAPGIESDARYAAGLLATILGDHTGSRLYWELVDPGLADGAELSYQAFDGTGAYFTFLSCDPENAQDNLATLARVCQRMMSEGPATAELEQAKNKVMARSVLRNERTIYRLMALGYYWAHRGEYLSQEEELRGIAAVTREDVLLLLEQWPLWPQTIFNLGPNSSVRPPDEASFKR